MSNNVIDNLTSVVIKAVERKVMAVKDEREKFKTFLIDFIFATNNKENTDNLKKEIIEYFKIYYKDYPELYEKILTKINSKLDDPFPLENK